MKDLFSTMKNIFICILLCLVCNSCFGQAKIANNESIEGRISRVGETQEWRVELPEDGTIEFSVRSQSFKMIAFLYRDDKPIMLLPVNNLGGRASSWGVGGEREIRCKPAKELPSGTYRIQVRSARDNELGKYEIQVHEPAFEVTKTKKNPQESDDLTIKDYLSRIDAKLKELEERVRDLEKKGSGK